MKIIAINGSPKKEGNTYHSLKITCDVLNKNGIETEILNVPHNIAGCMGCGFCRKGNHRCVQDKDIVNEYLDKVREADGIIIGTPVYFAGISGSMKSFIDRFFYVAGGDATVLRGKVGSCLVAVRRSGGVDTFDQLFHYLHYSEMFVPTSNYWNVIHGTTPGEVLKDIEGVATLQNLGEQMTFLLNAVNNEKKVNAIPTAKPRPAYSFIRD